MRAEGQYGRLVTKVAEREYVGVREEFENYRAEWDGTKL